MPPAASTEITLRMSRVRRAGKRFTSSSVTALPITVGMMRNGRNAVEHDERKERSALEHDAVGREHRNGHQHDHPARVDERLEQLGQVEREPVDRRRDEQIQIARQEETGERRDDVRQQQDREESDENQREQLSGQQRPDLLHAAEEAQQAKQQHEDERPEPEAEHARGSTSRSFVPRSPGAVCARAESHFGTSRCAVDGFGSTTAGARWLELYFARLVRCDGRLRAAQRLRSCIEDIDQRAGRVLAGQLQEDLLRAHRARLGARTEFVHRATRAKHAALHDRDAVAHRLGDLERVRRHHDGVAATSVFAKQILDDPRGLRIESDHRLVDDDHLGPVHERARDDELLPHAVAVALDELVALVLEIEQRQQLARAVLDLRPSWSYNPATKRRNSAPVSFS